MATSTSFCIRVLLLFLMTIASQISSATENSADGKRLFDDQAETIDFKQRMVAMSCIETGDIDCLEGKGSSTEDPDDRANDADASPAGVAVATQGKSPVTR